MNTPTPGYLIRLAGNALGVPDAALDGKFLKSYDPSANGGHGAIVVTDSPRDAMRFASFAEALECYRQQHGVRVGFDNKPNRPLTAFSIEIVPELAVIPIPGPKS